MGWLIPSAPASAATNIAASYVIGQSGSFTTSASSTVANRLSLPSSEAVDSVHHRMFVADTGNNRVTEYNLNTNNTFPDDTADYVLGQTGFGSNSSGTTASTMLYPMSVAYDPNNDRLYVVDSGNNRVLVFNTTTLSNGMSASYVLGQPDFVTTTAATTQSGLKLGAVAVAGLSLTTNGQYLFVPDSVNNRVMVWDTTSLSNGKNATYVIGQSSFTTAVYATANAGSEAPLGVSVDPTNTYFYVAETANRVSVFSVAGLATGMASTYLLGQTSISGSSNGLTQSTFHTPNGVASGNGKVFVSDYANQRVLVFDASNHTNGQNAIGVIGQPDYTTATANNGGTSATSLNYLRGGVLLDSSTSRLYIADYQNSRVLGYDTTFVDSNVFVQIDPTFTFGVVNQATACNGEPNFVTGAGTATAISFGHVVASSNTSGGQSLSVVSNDGAGFSVYLRGTQATQDLRSGSYNWTDVSGTYASPAALGSGERFGYTYKDSTVSSAVTNPGSATFAALTSTNQAVMGSTASASGSACVSFDAQTAANTPAGSYSATIIYTAVPVF